MYNSDLFDIDMAIEEAGELVVALSKLKRNKIKLTNNVLLKILRKMKLKQIIG